MNRVIIVTGSTRGIGLATAKEFLKNGDRVAVFCRHKDHLEEALRQLEEFAKENVLGLVGDVRKSADVKKIVAETLKVFERIDVLINNAGIGLYKLIEETSEAEWDDVLDTNLKGQFLFLREVLPIMKKQKNGVIINVSSGLGVQGDAKYSAYCSSKFGIIGLTQVAAAETKGLGIKVYAILPGAVATKLHLDMHPWEDSSAMMTPEHIAEKIFTSAEGAKKSGSSIEVYS
jgi:NAD(P)-dependent dehydrogenase (short-subunit alcohol dehydrogenase family)